MRVSQSGCALAVLAAILGASTSARSQTPLSDGGGLYDLAPDIRILDPSVGQEITYDAKSITRRGRLGFVTLHRERASGAPNGRSYVIEFDCVAKTGRVERTIAPGPDGKESIHFNKEAPESVETSAHFAHLYPEVCSSLAKAGSGVSPQGTSTTAVPATGPIKLACRRDALRLISNLADKNVIKRDSVDGGESEILQYDPAQFTVLGFTPVDVRVVLKKEAGTDLFVMLPRGALPPSQAAFQASMPNGYIRCDTRSCEWTPPEPPTKWKLVFGQISEAADPKYALFACNYE